MSKAQGREQLVREARVALPILGLLLLVFVFVAYRRFSGWADAPPASIRSQELEPGAQRDKPPRIPGAEIRRPETSNHSTIIAPADLQERTDSINPARQDPSTHRSPTNLSPQLSPGNPRSEFEPRSDTSPGYGSPLIDPNRTPSTGGTNSSPNRSPLPMAPSIGNPRLRDSGQLDPSDQRTLAGPPNSSDFQDSGSNRVQEPLMAPRQPQVVPDLENSSNLNSPDVTPNRPSGLNVSAIRLTIQEDDSYWQMSERSYGTGQYFRAIHALLSNASLKAKLEPGDTFVLPPLRELRERYPDLCPIEEDARSGQGAPASGVSGSNEVYTTNGGETLFQIAAARLGQASRYLEIVALNRSQLGTMTGPNDRLPANLRLTLPSNPR